MPARPGECQLDQAGLKLLNLAKEIYPLGKVQRLQALGLVSERFIACERLGLAQQRGCKINKSLDRISRWYFSDSPCGAFGSF